jgi:hypothetical protein
MMHRSFLNYTMNLMTLLGRHGEMVVMQEDLPPLECKLSTKQVVKLSYQNNAL